MPISRLGKISNILDDILTAIKLEDGHYGGKFVILKCGKILSFVTGLFFKVCTALTLI